MNYLEIGYLIFVIGCTLFVAGLVQFHASQNKCLQAQQFLSALSRNSAAMYKLELRLEVQDSKKGIFRHCSTMINSGIVSTIGMWLIAVPVFMSITDDKWLIGFGCTLCGFLTAAICFLLLHLKKEALVRNAIDQILDYQIWLGAKEVRAHLELLGIRLSNPSFDQFMARLEEEKMIDRKDVPEIVGNSLLTSRRYRLRPLATV